MTYGIFRYANTKSLTKEMMVRNIQTHMRFFTIFNSHDFDMGNVGQQVKKSLEFDYPPPKVVAFRRIHGFATAISTPRSGEAFSTLPRTEHVGVESTCT